MQSIDVVVGPMYVEVEKDNGQIVAGGFQTEVDAVDKVDVETDEVDEASLGTAAGDGDMLVEVIDDDTSEESKVDGAQEEIQPILCCCPMRDLLLCLFLLINGTFLVWDWDIPSPHNTILVVNKTKSELIN